jgi:hypothetical protein
MMSGGYYYPFAWQVRHFRPDETRETMIRFTPSGDPYGFTVKLPEKEPGAALEAEPARSIAETSASMSTPAALGSTTGNPTSEACALWAAAKASLTKSWVTSSPSQTSK